MCRDGSASRELIDFISIFEEQCVEADFSPETASPQLAYLRRPGQSIFQAAGYPPIAKGQAPASFSRPVPPQRHMGNAYDNAQAETG